MPSIPLVHKPVQSAEVLPASSSVLIVADGQRPEIRSLLVGASYPILWLAQEDALSAVSQHLALRRQVGNPVRALHWVSHGTPGVLKIGDTFLTEEDLQNNQSIIRNWGLDCLSFWSCSYAADSSIVSVWSGLTNALVFAAKQPLGQLENGQSSWELYSRDHQKQEDIPFALSVRETWLHQLGTGKSQSLGIPDDAFLSVQFSKFLVKRIADKKTRQWSHKLILQGDEQNSIWFQDRPLRDQGSFDFDSITGKKAWSTLFANVNPNSLLTGEGRAFVFENGPFKQKKNGRYVARIRSFGDTEDLITGEWFESSLLIDSTGETAAIVASSTIVAALTLGLFYVIAKRDTFGYVQDDIMEGITQRKNQILNSGDMSESEVDNLENEITSLKALSGRLDAISERFEGFENVYTSQLFSRVKSISGSDLKPLDELSTITEGIPEQLNDMLTDDPKVTDLLTGWAGHYWAKTVQDGLKFNTYGIVGQGNTNDLSAPGDEIWTGMLESYAKRNQLDVNEIFSAESEEIWGAFTTGAAESGYAGAMRSLSAYISSPQFSDEYGDVLAQVGNDARSVGDGDEVIASMASLGQTTVEESGSILDSFGGSVVENTLSIVADIL